MERNERGITLLALIITIIAILILAGVTIGMVMGDNGVIKKAQLATNRYNQSAAEEKLAIVLSGAEIQKNVTGLTDEQLDEKIETVGNLMPKETEDAKNQYVVVDGYLFEVDRTVPKIGKYIGEAKDIVFPTVDATFAVSADKKSATISITASEEKKGIKKIEIWQAGEMIKEFTYDDVKTEITEDYDVKQNGRYVVRALGEVYSSKVVEVTGIVTFVTGITVTAPMSPVKIIEGYPVQLTAIVEPENATNKEVTWTSSNMETATVSNDGIVTYVSKGPATIVAMAKDGSGIAGSISIEVNENIWTQDRTTVTNGMVTLEVGQAVTGYTANGVGDGNWCVLGVEEGKLLITTNNNRGPITLSGSSGYVNGVDKLNEEGAKFKDSNNMAKTARSLKVEDVNRVTGYKDAVARYNEGTSNVFQFDNEVTYTVTSDRKIKYKGTKYPIEAITSDDKKFIYWNGSSSVTLVDSITIKNTFYSYNLQKVSTEESNAVGINEGTKAYTLLSPNNGSYWLASKFEYTDAGWCNYGVFCVANRFGWLVEFFVGLRRLYYGL